MTRSRRPFALGPTLLLWLLAPAGASADVVMSTFPDCGASPDHGGAGCPNDFGEPWNYISYVKNDYKDQVRDEEWEIGSGMHLDRAFAVEVGDWDTTIAVMDSGIVWDEGNVRRKWRLNTGELPKPRFASGAVASSWDLDGNGVVNVDDYAQDARVSITAGADVADHLLDPSDLIATFSDNTDADANGFVDDICGWDFVWNDNDPFDQVENQGYSHGTLQVRDSAAEGNDGGKIGTCPNCSVIMLRVGTSFMANSTSVGNAIIYATDNGVDVLQGANATMDSSSFLMAAMDYAWSKGVPFIASAADEDSIHANLPGANPHAIVVHPNTYTGTEEGSSESFLSFHNCSNFGGRLSLSIATTGCSSEATAAGAGLTGLLASAALHRGFSLTTNEIYQLLTQTADDIYVPENYTKRHPNRYPSEPGWDRYTAYGRANVRAALDRIVAGGIPPEVDLDSPRWFEVLDPAVTPMVPIRGLAQANRSASYRWVLEYGVGLDPIFFTRIATGTQTAPLSGVLANWDLSQIPLDELDPEAPIEALGLDDDNHTRYDKVNRHTVTVRLSVTDAEGNLGEMRRTVYVQTDPSRMTGFPKYLGASMEASPKLVDLNGDGADEIVQTTADGKVHAFKWNGTELAGWPVQVGKQRWLDATRAGNHLNGAAFKSGAVSKDQRQLISGGAAVGDIDGDGDPEVVVGTEEGFVWAWHHTGAVVTGFPVEIDRSRATSVLQDPNHIWEDGIFAAPALGDLDGDGSLEIVVGAMDQTVYAWDGQGQVVPGWPVGVVYDGTAHVSHIQGRIMVTPAIGDIDGDGMNDVVVGSNETIDYEWSPTYVIHGDGLNHAGGPIHRGWPVLSIGLFGNMLPDIGAGTVSSPALADIDGDGRLEVATHTVLSVTMPRTGSFYDADGRVFGRLSQFDREFGAQTNIWDQAVVPLIGSGSFGDIDQDGDLDYTLPTAGSRFLGVLAVSNRMINGTFSTSAWDARTGDFLPGFPQQVYDMQLLSHQSIADISGDGMPEILSGSGALSVTAYDAEGQSPEGWPKLTGQWVLATPAVGDVDGDGWLEVVVGTRSGFLYAWHTEGRTPDEGGVVEWAGYHNDAANSGRYGALPHQEARRPAPPAPLRRR